MSTRTTYFYHLRLADKVTMHFEHEGTLASVLLRARRTASQLFMTWTRGQGPWLLIVNGRTGEKCELRL